MPTLAPTGPKVGTCIGRRHRRPAQGYRCTTRYRAFTTPSIAIGSTGWQLYSASAQGLRYASSGGTVAAVSSRQLIGEERIKIAARLSPLLSPLEERGVRFRSLIWSPLTESNRRPSPYHGDALPTELRGPLFTCLTWAFLPTACHPGPVLRRYGV